MTAIRGSSRAGAGSRVRRARPCGLCAGATTRAAQGRDAVRVSLVPGLSSRVHGTERDPWPAVSVPSCSPPVQASNFLTVGTPDANGAAANSVGSLRLEVKAHVA